MSLYNIRIKKLLSIKLDVRVGSYHGGNNVAHVAGKKRMQEMMTVASDAGEQFVISFSADAVKD